MNPTSNDNHNAQDEMRRIKDELYEIAEAPSHESPLKSDLKDRITQLLDRNKFIYTVPIDYPDQISLSFDLDDYNISTLINIFDDGIFYNTYFPFDVQFEMIPFVSTYLHIINRYAESAIMKLNVKYGVLNGYNKYLLASPDDFREKEFWKCLKSVVDFSKKHYLTLKNMSEGVLPDYETEYAKLILQESLNTISGLSTDRTKTYGLQPMRDTLFHKQAREARTAHIQRVAGQGIDQINMQSTADNSNSSEDPLRMFEPTN